MDIWGSWKNAIELIVGYFGVIRIMSEPEETVEVTGDSESAKKFSIKSWGGGLPIGIGAAIGAATGNMGVWIGIGAGLGFGIGFLVGLMEAKRGKRS